jgi:hypothetical protein
MTRSALSFVAAGFLAVGGLGLGSRSVLASPLEPTAQELGAFAMARALTLCYSTRMTLGPSRSRALAREILIKSGHDPDGAWVQVAPATEALADDLYRGLSDSCEINGSYVEEAAKRAAESFKGPLGAPAKGEETPPK